VPETSSGHVPLPALTGARFFAALSVVFFHYGLGALAPWLAIPARAGPAAVSFFYVLSGAVLTWGCTAPDGLPARPPQVFWSQRAARILPAYFLALALSLPPFAAHAWLTHSAAGAIARVSLGLVACALLVQAMWPPLAAGLNTPGWSISCEAFFYALWPRLVGKLRDDRPGLPWSRLLLFWGLGLVAPALALIALRMDLVPAGTVATLTEDASAQEILARTLSYLPPLRLPEFALGIAIGHALRRTPARRRSVAADTAREAILLAALIASARALGAGVPARLTGVPLANRVAIEGGALAPLFALWVWQLARGRGLLQRLLAAAPLQSLGEASYALYVLQEPVVVWLGALMKRAAPALEARWNEQLFWLYSLLIVAASLLVHRFVERPLRARLMAMSVFWRTLTAR
jgi:peptidoglycan/LPS O-acetylase OafA/YrhL